MKQRSSFGKAKTVSVQRVNLAAPSYSLYLRTDTEFLFSERHEPRRLLFVSFRKERSTFKNFIFQKCFEPFFKVAGGGVSGLKPSFSALCPGA